MKALNVSAVLLFFCLNIFDPLFFFFFFFFFLIGAHIDEKHFLIPA